MTPLDAGAAWRHLLELPPGGAGAAGPLHIHPDGSWSSSEETTDQAATLLDIFAPLRVRRRLVVGQLGQSLDGRIATESGHSHYINGPRDIERLHRLRALVQAVVVGAGTVESDDPRLTVRRVEGRHPHRVVLDPRGRLDPASNVFSDGAAPTLWIRGGAAPSSGSGTARPAGGPVAAEAVAPAGSGSTSPAGAGSEPPAGKGAVSPIRVEVVALPLEDGGFTPRAIVEELARRGIERILVEGGGVTVSRFLAAGALDRLHVSVAPLLIGSGRPSFTLPTVESLDQALRPSVRHFRLGTDLLFDLDLEGC